MGRDDAIETLHEQLQQTDRVAISAVTGMGGIGKTELALQYSQLHWQQKTYPGGMCWLRARDEVVGIEILNYARANFNLNPPEDYDLETQIAYCWRNWPTPPNPPYEKSDVLLVFDDVENYAAIENCLPSDSRFKILVTTRKQWLGESFQQLELQVLSQSAAWELLASFIGENRLKQEPEQAQLLCQDVGYLPLGLELVGRYLMRKPNLSLAKMRSQLSLAHNALQKRDRKGETSEEMTAKRGVEATFELSWQELDEEEQELACLLSLFALAPIPWQFVEQSLPEQDEEDLEEIRDDSLVNLSLLQRETENVYQLHPLIHQFLRSKLEQHNSASDLKRGFCQVMGTVAKKIPQTPNQTQIQNITPAIPHLNEVAEAFTDWLSDDDLIWLFTGLGSFYNGQGLYSQAEPYYEQCRENCQRRFGQEHPDVAGSLNNLAELYSKQGRYSEAEPLHKQALEMTQKLLGPEHPDVATSLNNLALLYDAQGRYNEAEPLYQQALEMTQKLLGQEHPDVAMSLNNLA